MIDVGRVFVACLRLPFETNTKYKLIGETSSKQMPSTMRWLVGWLMATDFWFEMDMIYTIIIITHSFSCKLLLFLSLI